jgi:hypothetical protein
MFRSATLTATFVCVTCTGAFGQRVAPKWHLVYTRSHRATFEQEWKYTFPSHKSKQWFIALRYPPVRWTPLSRPKTGDPSLHLARPS